MYLNQYGKCTFIMYRCHAYSFVRDHIPHNQIVEKAYPYGGLVGFAYVDNGLISAVNLPSGQVLPIHYGSVEIDEHYRSILSGWPEYK